jgi:hypothetical protein
MSSVLKPNDIRQLRITGIVVPLNGGLRPLLLYLVIAPVLLWTEYDSSKTVTGFGKRDSDSFGGASSLLYLSPRIVLHKLQETMKLINRIGRMW